MSEQAIKLSRQLREIAENLDQQIHEAAGKRVPFTLIVFTEDRTSYVSTCDRADSVREMRHLLDLWEQSMPDIEAHKIN